MKTPLSICFLLILLTANNLNGQEWYKIYFPDKSTIMGSAYESVDHGYVLGGYNELYGSARRGLIIKTDINGNMLWNKTISE